MIIKMNGTLINQYENNHQIKSIFDVEETWKETKNNLKFTSHMWIASSALSASPSIWSEMLPVFKVFQDMAMIVGALSILTGLIIMVFKKSLGWTVINTAIVVVLGCFLVPSAVMLTAIIGNMLNNSIQHAFEAFNSR